jgi:hypothetical protein
MLGCQAGGTRTVRAVKVLTVLSALMFVVNALVFYSIAPEATATSIEALKPTFGSSGRANGPTPVTRHSTPASSPLQVSQH